MELARRVWTSRTADEAAGASSAHWSPAASAWLLLDRGRRDGRAHAGSRTATSSATGAGRRGGRGRPRRPRAGSADGRRRRLLAIAEDHCVALSPRFGFGAEDGPGAARSSGRPALAPERPDHRHPGPRCTRAAVLRPRGRGRSGPAVWQDLRGRVTVRSCFDCSSPAPRRTWCQARTSGAALGRSSRTPGWPSAHWVSSPPTITTHRRQADAVDRVRSTDAWTATVGPWPRRGSSWTTRFRQQRAVALAPGYRFGGHVVSPLPQDSGRRPTPPRHDQAPEQRRAAAGASSYRTSRRSRVSRPSGRSAGRPTTPTASTAPSRARTSTRSTPRRRR